MDYDDVGPKTHLLACELFNDRSNTTRKLRSHMYNVQVPVI